MKYTIAICTYNGERWLSEVIESIVSLKLFSDLVHEVLIIDNASTDNTKNIATTFAKRYKKIKYIFEPKQGLSNARRRAVESSSDWTIFVDDDNILDSNWLIELDRTIKEHPALGIINGAVIATTREKLTEAEEIRLKVMYRNLACTHIQDISYPAAPNTEPIGAGLCIRTSALKKVSENGWLKLEGRKGKNLSSGEDTELCEKIKSMGYEYVCNYAMILYHIIPQNRLTEEYIDKLLRGLIRSRFILISNRKFYIIQRFIRYIKYLLIKIKNKNNNTDGNLLEKEKAREKIIIADEFLHCCHNTYFVKRELSE